jgi:ABC-type Na+ efflux pump permease subunit
MPDVVDRTVVRRRSVWTALLRKEWCEQRWRFFLATVVLAGLLAGLLRAQVVPSLEAEVLIYGPVGLILVIFLAAGPVAGERADRTWEFLVVQPVTRSDVILAKWAMGVLLLTGTMVISTMAGLVAMWSRGIRIMPFVHEFDARHSPEAFATWSTIHPALSLCAFAAVGTIALACWLTPLYLLLTRARNEFAAALGGIFLTIAVLLWLTQFIVLMARINYVDAAGANMIVKTGIAFVDDAGVNVIAWVVTAIWVVATILNPLSPFLLILAPRYATGFGLVLLVDLVVWVVLPLWWTCRNSGRLIGKWVDA